MAVNEAMACGRPAIVSDKVGCAKDLILDGETGYTFQSNLISSLVDALDRFKDFRLQELGVNCIHHIKKWNYVKRCEAIENAFS